MRIRHQFLLTLALCAASAATGRGQFAIRPDQPDTPVDAATTERVIKAISKALHDGYVFPETAEKMSKDLKSRVENKDYEKVTSSKELAKLLTEHLQAISKDKHLRVMYVAEPPPGMPRNSGRPSQEEQLKMRERMRARAPNNFDLRRWRRRQCRPSIGFAPAELVVKRRPRR